jgi:hypothetical protein
MILTLAWRSLAAHPVRSIVLGCGFGLGVAVMATLLGVGEVVLEQAKAPALAGGGHLLVSGASGSITSARFVQSTILTSPSFADRVAASAPGTRSVVYLSHGGRRVQVFARGGIPSLERALGDPETAQEVWIDTPADRRWSHPDQSDVLRAMDRFHPVPAVPARAASWAEWLYFNGRAGDARFYLTFLVGPVSTNGRRAASVRLQIERAGVNASFGDSADVDAADLLERAPDLTIGSNRVRLEGSRYRIAIDLPAGGGRRAAGELFVDPVPGRALPPFTIQGAGGWLTGYTVPAMSAALSGAITVGRERISLDGGSAYHDHNWGFWKGVSWRWGQVQHEGLSFLYGRVFPPPDAADPARMPGFLAALGPEGPIAYTTRVTIEETGHAASGAPSRIVVRGRGRALDLTMTLDVENAVVTQMAGSGPLANDVDFFQLRARYNVTGRAANRAIDFSAIGSAETFRGR